MFLDTGQVFKRPVSCPHCHEERLFTLRAIAASANIKHRFRAVAKACCVPIVVLLVIAALGPEKWAPRTHLGWQFDHFIGYFGITLFVCIAWPRPLLVGGIIMAVAVLLESLQALTPDRSANLEAALWGAGGALAAALVAEFFIQMRDPRGFARYFVAVLTGVAVTLAWQSYGDAAKQVIATKAPELGWSPEVKQMIASWTLGWTKPPASPEKIAPETVAPNAPPGPSLDPAQVQQMVQSLATLRQTVEQMAAGQDQLKRDIVQMHSALIDVLVKISEPPRQPPAAPARKPPASPSSSLVPIAPPSSLAPMPPRQ